MADETINIVATDKITSYSVLTVKGKSRKINYYALIAAIVISGIAIYSLSIESVFFVNAINTSFLALLDSFAFYIAITKVETERSSRSY